MSTTHFAESVVKQAALGWLISDALRVPDAGRIVGRAT